MIFLIKENGKSSKTADKYLLSGNASTLVSGGSVPDKPPRPTAIHEKQSRTALNQLTENELTKQSCVLISGGTVPVKRPRATTAIVISISSPPVPLIDSQG
ncbi:hypothetical protein [Pseudoalteromonas sp. MMG012]|uniref:hypothetical protein n=1 Tax=Pseudoalteromonas sp. MMG012 TaxID=2822686 RepID=UPI001B3A6481|nr:hypothetical protein [Pseudoalteromonas sp. MMG012]MBQ4849497.1 hypothetical protein [Pseudoalteromonas sp. MMG012]